MTLNITVAARWFMVQSSDFWLTQKGRVRPYSETAQKQVVLHYRDWSGLICYTGVAAWGSHDTAAWLSGVLTHEPGQRSPRQVIDQIVRGGNGWLRTVPAGQRHHTFTLITYERGIPYVYVISNFQRAGGAPALAADDHLTVYPVRPRRRRCIVTGQTPAVTGLQREQLEQLLAKVGRPPYECLRTAVALASRESSHRADDKVGEECVVAHLLPDGSGEAQIFGNLKAEFLPALILNGVNLATATPTLGLSGPSRLVGVTWTSNGEMNGMCGAYRELSKQTGDGWPDEEPVRPVV